MMAKIGPRCCCLLLSAFSSAQTPDAFNPGANNHVYSLAGQSDGKIRVGGSFTTLNGQSLNYIARLNADGTLDSEFNPGAGGAVYSSVSSLAVQADGKILMHGSFGPLVRLNPNGTLDSGFNPGANDYVSSLAVQADGKILVVGAFTTLGGQPRNRIARLNANGTLDGGFNPGADNSVSPLAMQADGKILVGGTFTTVGGQPRNYLARLNNTAPASQSLVHDGSTITWLRGGTSPEVWRTSFEASTNGSDWTSLGAGTRIAGGWRLTGQALPPNAVLAARGFLTDGGAASWFVETTTGPAVITSQPSGITLQAETTASFSVRARGAKPLR